MKKPLSSALSLLLALAASAPLAQAQNAAAGRQSPEALRQSVEQFLLLQSNGLPGKVTVTVGAVDTRLNLAPCPAPQAFMAPGARAWGKTTVGVRCTQPANWTIYLQANVAVVGDYVASAVPLLQGQAIDATQLVTMQGDLAALPAGIATDMSQVVGASSNVSLPPGTPMRLDTLRRKPVVIQGQLVRVVSSGNGFQVASEGRAIGNAGDGQVVQVRTQSGQQISGVARTGGMVEVAF
jgi:flagella basal body P-ring formation protein FlgA